MPFDLTFWKRWEGQSLDSGFGLDRCLGGSDGSAVFETKFRGRPAAIKIVLGTPQAIKQLLARVKQAAALSHPALVQIFTYGEAALGNRRCAYIVMERTDENLDEVLAERSLTPEETRAMLFPLLGALQDLGAKGFAHGRLKPANIMAVGEQLKISSDSLVQGGDSTADCGAIGTLLEEVLGGGQHVEQHAPFAEIARNCLLPDPAARWSAARIEAHLRGDPAPVEPVAPVPPVARTSTRAGWWSRAAVASTAGILGLYAMWPSPPPQDHNSNQVAAVTPRPPEYVAPALVAPETKPPAEAKKTAKAPKQPRPSPKELASAKPAGDAPEPSEQGSAPTTNGRITRVLPEIPQAALDTIIGQVRINVRVSVNSAGNVNRASLESPRASKYFTERVLNAAQAWKFPGGDTPQDWVLQFDLKPDGTRVSSVKVAN